MPESRQAAQPLLDVQELRVTFSGDRRSGLGRQAEPVEVLRGVTLTVRPGEVVGVVGESGAGKTLTALTVLGLLPEGARVVGGSVRLDGADLLAADREVLQRVRGGEIGLVFQEPLHALDPVRKVGRQVAEVVRVHRRLPRSALRQESLRLLELVSLPDSRRILNSYPHQLSGGERQRVMLALALAGGPRLLIADEPTTALDVVLRLEILRLVARLSVDLSLAVLWITHDLGVVASICDRVSVMYAGRMVEEGSVHQVLSGCLHPYTRALIAAAPSLGVLSPTGTEHGARPIGGQAPRFDRLPAGCAFHPRCGLAMPRCAHEEPPALPAAGAHRARCWLIEEDGVEGAGTRRQHRPIPPESQSE